MVIAVLILCVLCYFFANLAQNKFSKTLNGSINPTNYFQALWMTIAVIGYVVYQLTLSPFSFSSFTVTLGIIGGVLTFVGGLALLLALSKGPLSLTILIFSMYIVFPPLFSMIFLKEKATICQILGLILIILVMVITNFDGKDAKGKKSLLWWVLCVLSSVFTGISMFLMQYHQTKLPGYEENEYAIVSYFVGALISIVLAVVISRKNKDKKKEKYKFTFNGFFIPAFAMAILQGGAVFCSLYNASRLPAVILYPVSQLSTLMLTVIFSMVFLKEKPTKLTWCSLFFGCAAIMLMNF